MIRISRILAKAKKIRQNSEFLVSIGLPDQYHPDQDGNHERGTVKYQIGKEVFSILLFFQIRPLAN